MSAKNLFGPIFQKKVVNLNEVRSVRGVAVVVFASCEGPCRRRARTFNVGMVGFVAIIFGRSLHLVPPFRTATGNGFEMALVSCNVKLVNEDVKISKSRERSSLLYVVFNGLNFWDSIASFANVVPSVDSNLQIMRFGTIGRTRKTGTELKGSSEKVIESSCTVSHGS